MKVIESVRTCTVIAALSLGVGGASPAQDFVRGGVRRSSARIVSPTVVSTYLARDQELVLLVLFRGSPGWFERGGGPSGGGGAGGTSGGSWISLAYGGLSFRIDFDDATSVASLLGQRISLNETNVVLVDQVDSQLGPSIVRVERVESALPSSGDVALTVLKRQPELVEFLQCDLVVPDPVIQALVTIACGQIRN